MDIELTAGKGFEQLPVKSVYAAGRGVYGEGGQIRRKPTYKRPVSIEERIRMKKRRKRIARWRRIKRVAGRLLLLAVLLTVMVFAILKVVGLAVEAFMPKAGAGRSFAAKLLSDDMKTLWYDIKAPQVFEGDEMKERLAELAGEYPGFSEVYENMDKYPEDLLAALCNNPEMIDFVKGYPENAGMTAGELTQQELQAGIPHLLQWDKRWGYAAYGENNMIALTGCAPTCMSMIIVGLTGNKAAKPDVIASYAMQNGFYVEGTGTAWSLMTEGGQQWGVYGREISLMESNIVSELEAGHPIICSVHAGDFTTEGHFIVLAGMEDGKIRVNDPNSISRSNMLWDYSVLEEQISNLWVFYKY
ncbi:MAG: C39 family peptidase [Clostridium sp.]|nr:C39 family peptidase [Clostridium sp.]